MDDYAGPVRVDVDPGERSDWTVDPAIFGRFAEHLGGAIYPGVFEDYVENGSFEVWNASGADGRAGLAFRDVSDHGDVAYPWQPVGGDDASHEQRVGGVRGRRETALDEGVEVPEGYRPEPPGVTESRYQRVALDGEGGVEQRVALPDRRTSSFDVALSVRGEGVSECTVALRPADGREHEGGTGSADAGEDRALARASVPVGENWARHAIELTLDRESPRRYDQPRYGVFTLSVTAEGRGVVDLDWVTLVPADAVEGRYNPTTVERLREFEVTSLRWPGGNYASQYRWRDGVGPVADRPVVPVANWGGLEPNYLGTNEWLRFCELVDAEPYVTVPFWSPAGPEEAAAWVEYCNGATDTEMGALRADHGHPEPWDVTWWGIGNEVWGPWQVGRTDARDYAERYQEYYDAMRAVDPGIEIDACGIDPWYTLVDEGGVEAAPDRRPVWNELLLEAAGDRIDGLDVHRYTEGISGHTSEPGAREAWIEEHEETPTGYVEVLVNDPGSWDAMLDEIRAVADRHGVDDLRLTVGEWGLRSNEVEEGWPRPGRGTMAHAVHAARALQAFVRNGENVDMAHWTDFSLYVHPRPGADGPDDPHPGAHVFGDLAGALRDGDWHRIGTDVSDSPTRRRPETGVSIPAGDVALVDAVTVGTAPPDRRLRTVLANGSLTRPADVVLDCGERVDAASATVYRGTDGDPFARPGDDGAGFEVDRLEPGVSGTGAAELSLPPGSVAVVSLEPSG